MALTAATDQGPAQPQANVAWQLSGSIAAAIAGALIPTLFGASATGRLAGMLAGAVVPPLITHVGRWQPLRTGAGVAVALAAIAVTYLGGTAVDREAFPGSDALAQEIQGGPAPAPAPKPDPNVQTMQEDDVGIRVDHKRLRCESEGSCDDVTITSLGPKPLQLFDIGFEEGAVEDFSDDDSCDHLQSLAPGDSCAFAVSFAPQAPDGRPREAMLVIHQNLEGPATRVAVAAVSPPAPHDDVGIVEPVGCAYTPEGRLAIAFDVSSTGDRPEAIRAYAATGAVTAETDVVAGETTTLTLPDPGDAGSPPPLDAGRHELSVGIEPGGGFTDGDPHNNRLALTVEIPAEPPVIEPISLACRPGGEGA